MERGLSPDCSSRIQVSNGGRLILYTWWKAQSTGPDGGSPARSRFHGSAAITRLWVHFVE
jgi:hypothetical protein